MRVFCLASLVTLTTAANASAVPYPSAVNVKDCYATGYTDDQALHEAVAVALGNNFGFGDCGTPGVKRYIGSVFVSPGVYTLTTPLVLTKPMALRGVRGRWTGTGSVILAGSPAPNPMIKIQTDDPVVVEDLQLSANTQAVGSDAIYVTGGTSENNSSTIERVSITHAQTGIHLAAAASATIRNCHVEEPKAVGILVENTAFPDHGDSTIEGSVISSGVPDSVGIRQFSSGGLRLVNNKIIGNYPTTQGMSVGYQLLQGSNASTSILVIVGNSIEGQRDRGIQITRTATSSEFFMITIGQNEIAGQAVGIEIFDGATPKSATWLRTVSIVGNVMMWQTTAAIGLHQVDGVFVATNVMHSLPTGIFLNPVGVTPTNVNIGGNTYVGVTTHIANPTFATLCPPSTCN